MALTVIIHVQNEEAIVAEIDDLPDLAQQAILVSNPRRIDGKDLQYLAENVTQVIFPISRINFIEIMPTREEEEIIGFVRE